MLPPAPPITGFAAPGPYAALTGPAADNVSLHIVGGSSRQISNDRFEKKEDQHIRLAQIFLRLKQQIIVHLEGAHQNRVFLGLEPAGSSAFDDHANPAIGVIAENKTFIYINNKGERICANLVDITHRGGGPHLPFVDELEHEVAEMIKVLRDVEILSTGGHSPRFFVPSTPRVSLLHGQNLFDYIGTRQGDDLLDKFQEEMLKHIGNALDDTTKQEFRDRVRRELTGETEPVHKNLRSKCDGLRGGIQAKVGTMDANPEAQHLLNSSVHSTDIFSAKMLVILRHLMEREMESYAGAILAAAGNVPEVTRLTQEQATIKQNLGTALKAFVVAQRDAHESRDSWVDFKYYLSQKEIDEDQKNEEDRFIDDLIKLASNDNPQDNPGCLEDILLVGPIHYMKSLAPQGGGESDAVFAARVTAARANLVRLDKLIGYGTSQHHYMPIHAVRTDPAQGVLYPGPLVAPAAAAATATPAAPGAIARTPGGAADADEQYGS